MATAKELDLKVGDMVRLGSKREIRIKKKTPDGTIIQTIEDSIP